MEDQCYEMEQLPSMEDLTPITQSLISPQLAIAFGIIPEPSRTIIDLNLTSNAAAAADDSINNFQPLSLFPISGPDDESNSGSKDDDDSGLSRAVKRPRLVWTPQLHKRFVDVIQLLGIDKAVPKTIMEMMNVEGLTRENVASHLQKYRLYLKRMEGISGDVCSPTPVLSNCHNPNPTQQLLPCNGVSFIPLPMVGPPSTGPYGFGPGLMGFPVGSSAPPGYCGLESGAYNLFWNRQRG